MARVDVVLPGGGVPGSTMSPVFRSKMSGPARFKDLIQYGRDGQARGRERQARRMNQRATKAPACPAEGVSFLASGATGVCIVPAHLRTRCQREEKYPGEAKISLMQFELVDVAKPVQYGSDPLGIYTILCVDSRDRYVGQSGKRTYKHGIINRLRQHRRKMRDNCVVEQPRMAEDFERYGLDSFRFLVVSAYRTKNCLMSASCIGLGDCSLAITDRMRDIRPETGAI